MKYLSLGGWCGTTMSLRGNSLYMQAYPFDHVRSTFEGVLECIQNDFSVFFPNPRIPDFIEGWEYNNRAYRNEFVGFYHHDLKDNKVVSDFERRILRFKNDLKYFESTKEKIVFIRTVVTDNPNEELNLAETFKHLMEDKYPNLNYILAYVITGQDKTTYYKKLMDDVYVFTSCDKIQADDNKLSLIYKPIYEMINAYVNKGKTFPNNQNINIKHGARFWIVHGQPMVKRGS